MSQHYDESCAGPFRSELDASNLRRGDDVASNTDDKQVTKALIEDDLRRHSRIGTSEDNGERLLACYQRLAACLVRWCVAGPLVRYESTIARTQAFECIRR
jgi:hypothetical protein